MKISCPTCAAKYSVADEKIQSRLAKIRCRKCSSTIVIDGTSSPARVYIGDASAVISASGPPHAAGLNEAGVGESLPSAARVGASAPAPAGSDSVGPAPDEYAVDIADNDQRNMTIHQIIGAYNEGLISADTYIWKEGMADWQTLAEVRDVADALRAAARPVAATPAAVRRPDQGTTPDLFGRIHTAGSEDDITTSAPEPAPALTAGTGARNESSVLFSLSALTGTAGPASSSSAAPKRGRDDSGLIDLHALTEAAGPGGGFSAPAGAFGASPLISAPLGSGAAPLGAGMLQGYGQRSGSRLNLIIAILLLAIGIIGGAAFVVNRGNGNEAEPQALREPKKEATPSSLDHEHAASPKPIEPVADRDKPVDGTSEGRPSTKHEAVAAQAPAPKEPPSAAAEPAPAPKPAPHPQIVRISKPAPRSSVSALPPAPMPTAEPPAPKPAPKPVAEAAPSEPKKKAVPACICKPADLLCAMKCSAGKK